MAEDFLSRIQEYKEALVAMQKKRRPEASLRNEAESMPAQRRGLIRRLEEGDGEAVHIIAEIKRASPSKGVIREPLDPAAFAAAYEAGGASAVSVLTEDHFFKGSVHDLVAARRAVSLPVLRKDFIVSTYQIYESALIGADAVLLIVRMLSKPQLADYLSLCEELGLDALVEVHSQADIHRITDLPARLVGINNRNLQTFDMDPKNAVKLTAALGPGRIPVAASAIRGREDIEFNLHFGIRHFLVGESIVRSDDPAGFIRGLKEATIRV